MSIKHDHTLNPVTALEFYQSSSTSGVLILAGEGCYLKVFDAKASILLYQLKAFQDQAIHGITVRQNDALDSVDDDLEIAIWGGSSLNVFTRKNFAKILASADRRSDESTRLENPNNSSSSSQTSDWILDVAISQNGECILVTAHNTVLRAKINGKSLALETLLSPSRSILYSAQLIYESENNILVAAGTVFGEIIVWRCSIDSVSSGSQVLHTFTGHEGSIFGVTISPVVADRQGNPTRLLASCSDDRTIRIWTLNLGGSSNTSIPGLIAGRETGFGSNEEQGDSCNKCVAIVMGHASRIWSVQFLIKNSDITVLSFGEDATTQYWKLENSGYKPLAADAGTVQSPDLQAKLTSRDIFSFNSGKHIWSKAVRSSDDGPAMVVTGGADGKISLYEAPAFEVSQSQAWSIEDVLEDLSSIVSTETRPTTESLVGKTSKCSESSLSVNIPQQTENSDPQPLIPERSVKRSNQTPKKPFKDAFNRYAFVAENQVLVTTTFGRVFLGKIGPCITWKEVDMPAGSQDLRSYSVIKGIPEIGIAFLGSANGTIFLYRAGVIQEFGKIPGKVADMFIVYDATLVKVELLATNLGSTVATLFKCSAQEANLASFESVQTQRLRLLDKFIVTSAGKTAYHLVLGSRTGALAVYNPEKFDEPACTWLPATAGDAVTSISKLPNSGNGSNSGYFLTTGRNGTYSIFSLTDSIRMVHQGTPPFGPMIEAAWFSGTNLILYGFKSKNFIVWNETQQYEISSVECGGAHRSYSYSPVAGSDGAGYFIYTKASKLYLHSQSRPSHRIIKYGGHGREIKACALSPDGLIATGAEDTAIRIWWYQDAKSPVEKQFNCPAVVQKHTTGIQHLQWHGSSYLFSSGGNEEFFIWAVEMVPGFGIGLVCEASCPDQSEERDLRIMSFDVGSLSVSDNGSETLLISLAYSDSTIRCYTYSKVGKSSLVARGQYTSSCLMQLRHLKIGQEVFFLTAGTDGHMTVWKTALPAGEMDGNLDKCSPELSSSNEATDSGSDHSTVSESSRDRSRQGVTQASKLIMLSNHRLHQSSIKSLDVATKDNNIIVATGGDDNALGVTVYQANDLTKKSRSFMVRSAHAAAITGLSFVSKSPAEDGGEMRIVTSSNDQRIKEWALCMSSGQMNDIVPIRKVGDIFTSVADVGDLATLIDAGEGGSGKVLVLGNGMEVYEVYSETNRQIE